MAAEGKLQSKIIRWLKDQGAYVIKTRPGPGTPVGCPDIVFLYRTQWGVIEVKGDAKSSWQPGQKETLDFLYGMNPFVFRAYPDNWPDIQNRLLTRFF
jgi:hypothetical protein